MSEHDKVEKYQKEILLWFEQHARSFPWRNPNITKYKKIIAEILLQRTKAETISNFIPIFYKKLPSWQKLSVIPMQELEDFIQPIGLVNRRSDVLISLSKEMVCRGGRIPCNRGEIDKLPGVGQYIGNSIELLCCGKRLPLLDVNMARVLERYFGPRKLVDIRYDPYLQDLAHTIVDVDDPIKMNWAILDFAALVCKKRKPKCEDCPINKNCKYFNNTKEVL